jgi:hypothetical protein
LGAGAAAAVRLSDWSLECAVAKMRLADLVIRGEEKL